MEKEDGVEKEGKDVQEKITHSLPHSLLTVLPSSLEVVECMNEWDRFLFVPVHFIHSPFGHSPVYTLIDFTRM